MATITLKGTEFHTNGDVPAVGTTAPTLLNAVCMGAQIPVIL